MDENTGLILLAAAFGIGLILWLLKGSNEQEPNRDKDIATHRQQRVSKTIAQNQSQNSAQTKKTAQKAADNDEAAKRKAKERARAREVRKIYPQLQNMLLGQKIERLVLCLRSAKPDLL